MQINYLNGRWYVKLDPKQLPEEDLIFDTFEEVSRYVEGDDSPLWSSIQHQEGSQCRPSPAAADQFDFQSGNRARVAKVAKDLSRRLENFSKYLATFKQEQ